MLSHVILRLLPHQCNVGASLSQSQSLSDSQTPHNFCSLLCLAFSDSWSPASSVPYHRDHCLKPFLCFLKQNKICACHMHESHRLRGGEYWEQAGDERGGGGLEVIITGHTVFGHFFFSFISLTTPQLFLLDSVNISK